MPSGNRLLHVAPQPNREENIALLRANVNKVVRVKFTEDALNPLSALVYPTDETIEDEARRTGVQELTVSNVDDEGFVCEINGHLFWSTFDDVESVEPVLSE